MDNKVGVEYIPGQGYVLNILIREMSEGQKGPTLQAIEAWMEYLLKIQKEEIPSIEGPHLKVKRDGSYQENDILDVVSDEELRALALAEEKEFEDLLEGVING